MSLSKNITIAQIAREASVSVATVSRIINKNGYVSSIETKETLGRSQCSEHITTGYRSLTRQKVIEAMDALGYQPKFMKSDSAQNSYSLLVCLPDFRNPFNSDVIDGIQATALSRGYRIIAAKKPFSRWRA